MVDLRPASASAMSYAKTNRKLGCKMHPVGLFWLELRGFPGLAELCVVVMNNNRNN
jgi:hypothetical protein